MNTKQKRKTRIVVLLAFVAAILGSSLYICVVVPARNRSLLNSCSNHISFLCRCFDTERSLPHEDGVPGCVMLAKAMAKRDRSAHMNCNHGATDSFNRIGGWQAVNLPPEEWTALRTLWKPTEPMDDIPFFWCGRPSGLRERFIVFASYSNIGTPTEGWYLRSERISEEKLRDKVARLNEHLRSLGKPAVSQNIPNDVNWQEYDMKDD